MIAPGLVQCQTHCWSILHVLLCYNTVIHCITMVKCPLCSRSGIGLLESISLDSNDGENVALRIWSELLVEECRCTSLPVFGGEVFTCSSKLFKKSGGFLSFLKSLLFSDNTPGTDCYYLLPFLSCVYQVHIRLIQDLSLSLYALYKILVSNDFAFLKCIITSKTYHTSQIFFK